MSMNVGASRRPMAEINVTPLVDVVLVLLVIFMVTAPFLQGGLEIDLPKVATRGLDVREGLVVSVRADRTIAVGSRVVRLAEFESAIARAVGTAHAAAVSSGTAAIHLALLALEIGPGDEVIVPAYTFPATANAVELCGARAVLVDVDPETFVVDPAAVAAALTPRTRAVIAVHLFGRPVDWEALQTAVPQEVVLVEDAAGALGARDVLHAVRDVVIDRHWQR